MIRLDRDGPARTQTTGQTGPKATSLGPRPTMRSGWPWMRCCRTRADEKAAGPYSPGDRERDPVREPDRLRLTLPAQGLLAPGALSAATSPPNATTASCSRSTTVYATRTAASRDPRPTAAASNSQSVRPRTRSRRSAGLGQRRLCRQAHRLGGQPEDPAGDRPQRDAQAFEVLLRRWVVERALAWTTAHRRCARDYERLPESHEAMVLWAMIALITQAPPPV